MLSADCNGPRLGPARAPATRPPPAVRPPLRALETALHPHFWPSNLSY